MSETPPPPPPSSPPPPPPPATTGSTGVATGPLGRRRSMGLVILLSIVTCGIWTLVWAYQNGNELKEHTGRGIGGVGYLFITLLVSPVTMFLMANEVEQMYRAEGKEPPITTIWGLWFLLPLIGPIIWYVRIQDGLNQYWTTHGATNEPKL